MSLKKIGEWDQKELEELVKKLSVNYKPQRANCSYPMRDLFYKKAQVNIFKEKNLSPEILPTESTIMMGNALTGKTLLMKAWKELLSNRIKKTTSLMDSYSRKYENQFNSCYSQALAKNSSKWIYEKDTSEWFDNYTKSSENDYTEIVFKKYYFLDDLFFRKPYPFGSEKKTDQNFLSFQESLFRFLETDKDIIVIASTNNMPQSVLLGDKNGTIRNRFEAIFKAKIGINHNATNRIF